MRPRMARLSILVVFIPVATIGALILAVPSLFSDPASGGTWTADKQEGVALLLVPGFFMPLVLLARFAPPRPLIYTLSTTVFVTILASSVWCVRLDGASVEYADARNEYGELTVLLTLGYPAFMVRRGTRIQLYNVLL